MNESSEKERAKNEDREVDREIKTQAETERLQQKYKSLMVECSRLQMGLEGKGRWIVQNCQQWSLINHYDLAVQIGSDIFEGTKMLQTLCNEMTRIAQEIEDVNNPHDLRKLNGATKKPWTSQ